MTHAIACHLGCVGVDNVRVLDDIDDVDTPDDPMRARRATLPVDSSASLDPIRMLSSPLLSPGPI